MRRRLALWAVVAAGLFPPTANATSGLESNELAAGTDTSQVSQSGAVVSGDSIAAEDEVDEKQAVDKKQAAGREDEADEEDEAAESDETSGEEAANDDTGTAGSGSLSSLAIGDGAATLDELDVPVALLPVYQACGSRYGISWEVLAAINKIETGGGNGQTWTDDPVDAICSAARYLAASGGEEDIYAAVYAYNHADWYVREVLADARTYERVPANLVNSLTALASGSTSPVSAAGTEARAVVDGKIVEVGRGSGGGRYLVLRDAYGDRFTYSSLDTVAAAEGDSVAAGTVLGRGADGSVGFAARLAGSSQLDPTELLEIWRRGGTGAIYDLDGEAVEGEGAAAATRALLMSAGALRRAVLADEDLELANCVREAVSAGDLQQQSLAALEYLTASGYEIGVDASTCRRRSGFVLEIDSVDGAAAAGNQGQGTAAHELVRTALAMEGSTAPQRVVSATGLSGSSEGRGASSTIELDYRPPQKARLVDGEAIAPVGAPVAVQAMIAAANQINGTPYIWGGGHGSWVSSGYDCSGAVSYVLHAAGLLDSPLTSGSLESWGESGSGRWVTVYANAEHTYAMIAGLRWDTSGDTSGSGPRWHTDGSYPAGFSVRHPAGY